VPDKRTLKPGHWIRLLSVPEGDRRQREQELLNPEADMPGWTADTIERILRTDPVVRIDRIDEYGFPWFDYDFPNGERHAMTIMDDASWEFCEGPR
jgi:hypothetical protein